MEEVGVIEQMTDEGYGAPLSAGPIGRMCHHGAAPLLALDVMLARQLVERLDDGYAADDVVICRVSAGRSYWVGPAS
jgi:hypothetical protein